MTQAGLYAEACDQHGPALERLARAYEADPEKRRDLLQDIHLQLWTSFRHFDARCSLRTWIYRVAHHTATSHVIRERRRFSKLVSLQDLENLPAPDSPTPTRESSDLDRLAALIQRLKPVDRQVIVSYLEDLDAATIAEITGLSTGNVAVRIHRIKYILARQFREGGPRDERRS